MKFLLGNSSIQINGNSEKGENASLKLKLKNSNNNHDERPCPGRNKLGLLSVSNGCLGHLGCKCGFLRL